jgi:hypothetical protein
MRLFCGFDRVARQKGRRRTASYAAVRRGEVPAVTIGGRMWIPPDWRDQVAALAVAEMQQKRQRHAAMRANASAGAG